WGHRASRRRGLLRGSRRRPPPRDRSAGDHPGVSARLVPDLVLTEGGFTSGRAVTLADGRIASIEPWRGFEPGDVVLEGKALLPGTVNAHRHPFPSLLRGLGPRPALP